MNSLDHDIVETRGIASLQLIDFYADWCEPCKWLDPILQEIERDLYGYIEILKIDIDKDVELSQRYDIKSVPTLILFKNGEIVWRMSGFKTAPELVTIIKKFIT